jgi:hypothetical protein
MVLYIYLPFVSFSQESKLLSNFAKNLMMAFSWCTFLGGEGERKTLIGPVSLVITASGR